MVNKTKRIQIVISGKDAQDFLQGQLTADISSLKMNSWLPAAHCTPQGKVLATMWVIKIAQTFRLLLLKERAEFLEKRLKMFALHKDVQISRDETTQLQSLSDNSRKVILEHSKLYLGGLGDLSSQALIQAEFVEIYAETADQFLPQMLGLEKNGGLSYQKGCYIGQEAISRAHYKGGVKRHLARLTGSTPTVLGEVLKVGDYPAAIVLQSAIIEENYILLAVLQDRYRDSELVSDRGEAFTVIE